MKTFLLSLGAAALLTLPAAGQLATTATAQPMTAAPARPAVALTPDEQLFTTLLNQVGAAIEKGDMVALGKFMAPEYVHYNPNNGSGARAEDLAYIGTWGKTGVKVLGPVRVNRYGNTAVTVATSVFSGNDGGKPSSRAIQMMIVWVLRAGNWQMAVVQSKEVPA